MDVDAWPEVPNGPLASTSYARDVDEKPDVTALEAGERRAAHSSTRYTKDGKKILKEYPIFFTTELAEYLTLLQYPHRWRDSRMNSQDLPIVPKSQEKKSVHARIKPSVNILEVGIPIEGPGSASYSKQKGDEMGRGVDSADLGGPLPLPGKKKASMEDARPLDRMTLRAEGLADQTNYCAGLLMNDGLHLTPLLSTLQLRASLTYLDRNKARERERKARGGAADADEVTASEESDEEENEDEFQAKKKKLNGGDKKPEARTLTQTDLKADATAGSAGDKGVGRATASLFAPLKADAMEGWTNLAYFNQRTDEANCVAQALLCQQPEKRLQVTTRTSDHLAS